MVELDEASFRMQLSLCCKGAADGRTKAAGKVVGLDGGCCQDEAAVVAKEGVAGKGDGTESGGGGVLGEAKEFELEWGGDHVAAERRVGWSCGSSCV